MVLIPYHRHMEDALKKRIAKAPDKPGVYRWLDAKGNVLYIGKAKNLRSRMKSYANDKNNTSPWKRSLAEHTKDFDVTITNTELEALILETNLIKEEKPKYNVLMKDDKNYLYVRITVNDAYPTVTCIRRMAQDGAKYFGPYTNANGIRKTVEMLHTIFPYKACRASLEQLNRDPKKAEQMKNEGKACLEYQIGQCCGLCVGEITQKQYGESVEEIIRFLSGNQDTATLLIRERMEEAAKAQKFEKASKLRDTLKYIEEMGEGQLASDTSGEDTDIIAVALCTDRAQAVLFQRRNGKIIGEQSFTLAGSADTEAQVLEQLLPQYYESAAEIPPIIILEEKPEESSVLETWLSEKAGKSVKILVPERGKKSHTLKLAKKNAQQKVKQLETKWESALRNTEDALEELAKVLKLPKPPKRIEGYDISHLGGTETVGSMAVLRKGKASPDHYRSFTIRTMNEGEIDDYKALKEVLTRRLKYLSKTKDVSLKYNKMKKKDREDYEKKHKSILLTPKGWHSEIVEILQKKNTIARLRLQRKTKEKTLYGSIEILSKKREEIHSALDLLEEKLGKYALYIFVSNPAPIDLLAVHRFTPSVKKIPTMFAKKAPKKKTLFHKRKTPKEDVSLNATPDLLVIDGGKGQLSSAVKVLKKYNLKIPVIGLAKQEEEVFIPKKKDSVSFKKDSPAKFLLARIRDEAHRFANRHREGRGEKAAISSALDSVPGIGPRTKKELLKKFGSVDGIKKASDMELESVLSERQIQKLRSI